MQPKKTLMISILTTTIASSCGSPDEKEPNLGITSPLETITPSKISSLETSKAKFNPFNNIDDVRQKLSTVGIGELGRWRDDEMGGFMSITPYYQFSGGNTPNNLAYYLESDNPKYIKTLKVVLNINNGDRNSALSKFTDTVRKTYKALNLTINEQIINAAKSGKEIKSNKDTRTEVIELEESRIETWKFIIETK